jgi:hypothetical protein
MDLPRENECLVGRSLLSRAVGEVRSLGASGAHGTAQQASPYHQNMTLPCTSPSCAEALRNSFLKLSPTGFPIQQRKDPAPFAFVVERVELADFVEAADTVEGVQVTRITGR